MSEELLDKMKRHHARILSLKWQYYGNEHGTLYTYPAVGTCGVTNYDPRVRYILYTRPFIEHVYTTHCNKYPRIFL